jgi:FMN-dependent NADH-azoreductase
MMDTTLSVLRIDSSGRTSGSVTRALAGNLLGAMERRYGPLEVVRRDLASGIPHVDQDWIDANFTPAESRSAEQVARLGFSDTLVAELNAADIILIGMPIYNFGIPAALKAWVDMIARARLTFRYSDNGPVGLLKGKKACLVVASGGVAVGSAVDFATPYMRHALGFIGINDVEVIAADQQTTRGNDSLVSAGNRIETIAERMNVLVPAEYAA